MTDKANVTTVNLQTEVSKSTLKELILKYLSYLPLFILSLVICVGISIVYLRYKIPVYKVAANMLIKNGDDYNVISNSNSGGGDFIQKALFGGKSVSIDNEIELIRSKPVLQRVVAKYNFNTSYYVEGSVKRTEIYGESPVTFFPIAIADSNMAYAFYVKNITKQGGQISTNRKFIQSTYFKWRDTVQLANIVFQINPRIAPESISGEPSKNLIDILWQPTASVAGQIQGALSVVPFSAKTSILQLSMVTGNIEKGKDILNAIIKEYDIYNIEQKKKVSASTIAFIDQRLDIVTNELENVENTQRDFTIKNGILTDLTKESEANYTDYNFTKKAIQTVDQQIETIDRLDKYVRQNKNKIVPSSFTLVDIPITGFIGDYNKLQLAREKYGNDVLPDNPELLRLDTELASLKTSLFEGLRTLRNNLLAQKSSDKSIQGNAYSYLASVPDKRKYLQELARQQSLKQALYLYLLQKREEIAIATSTTLSNYQPVDYAQSLGQIEPKESNIKNFGLILGFLIPIGIIYLLDLLNDKLTTRDDIVKRTTLPIVGEISHIDKSMDIIVVGQSRNMIAEQFRILRSNLQFLLKRSETCKTFLITSSISGEGKSFMSINLAAVLSLSGKKVALLEFDLRKMRNIQYKGEKQNTKGITNYLIGQTNDHNDIITEIENLPFLHIYRSGPIPPNPGELIMSDKVKTLIDELKSKYDYIVIDSAPVGLVSDSYSLVQFCDSTLYVLRQRYTYKKQVEFIEEIRQQGKLTNIALIVNDVHMGGKYGYYGYGNSYGYGYIYRYGFGYRYGYGYGTYTGKYFKKGTDGYFDLQKKDM